MTGSLFDEPSNFDRDRLAARLSELARQNIFVGGSSWKYEGWIGQIYSQQRYMVRGRFSKSRFEQECLREYAETFPIVCGDFAFYQFPSDDYWRKLFSLAPPTFKFALKAPEQITAKAYPVMPRYGALAGTQNETFLSAHTFRELFLRPLWPYRDRTAVIIFEFGAFGLKSMDDLSEFLDTLDPFLASLPPEFQYGVEIRNPEFLHPDYFSCLANHNVAHVYNAWARMPELREQISIAHSATANFSVCRALLRRGRAYEQAVAGFSPYREIRDPNPEARDSMRALIERAKERKHSLFLFVNNRLEGNSPLTIMSLVEPEET